MFKVQFKKSVEKDLRALPKADQKRTLDHIGKVLAKDYSGPDAVWFRGSCVVEELILI